MADPHLVIVGGGLAGLATGCYARRSGLRTTIVEHNLALGGVCTAWSRAPYTVDGCIHWLTGGAFARLYAELGITPTVPLRPLETWVTYRDAADSTEVAFVADLDRFFGELRRLAPEDGDELDRLRSAADEMGATAPPIDAVELAKFSDSLRMMWNMRSVFPALVHFRKPIGVWASEHLTSPRLRRLFTRVLPETAPASFLAMVLAYLERGFLSRPIGGTAAFRDALVATYQALGGEARLHATVDEIVVERDCATGVRLSDGTMIPATAVVSTASSAETVLRLLGGRFDAHATRNRLERWKLFDPIVLASFGVAAPYADMPSMLVVDHAQPLQVGANIVETLALRVCNDDPSFAPPGHTVVQAILPTGYEWWATRGAAYQDEKDALARRIIATLAPHFPGIEANVRMIDLATPLTYWSMARAWRGAFEGWMPNHDTTFGHIKKTLSGLHNFYMAGQWVEPGGGVPTSLLSGRQAAQLACHHLNIPFVSKG